MTPTGPRGMSVYISLPRFTNRKETSAPRQCRHGRIERALWPLLNRGAIRFCEGLRHAVEFHDWRAVHPELSVTLSIGLSQWDGTARIPEFLNAADSRLYHAKRAGRNRVL